MNGIEPTSIGEFQLYKVLQRANLLNYYEIFISQGGDDVQQLCEAGEEEFLEIMSLVGMASKPLHVRRFQKALQEWVTSPHIFQKSSNSTSKGRSSFAPPSSHSAASPILNKRPHSVPTVSGNHKSRNFKPAVENRLKVSPNHSLIDESQKLQEILSQKLDEKTVLLLTKFAAKEVEERFPHRCSFEQAVDRIKTSKKRPHLIRTLEMTNVEARNKEIRRQSSLFPVHFADRFSSSPLSLFEMMCNEAAAHLCTLHPMLLVADRAQRLDAAQAVVRKVERETQQTQRSRLDFSSEGNFPGQADEIIAKLNEVKVKQSAFKQKIASAEATKNFVHLLEYQSELSRLKQEEQSLMRQKGKMLTQGSLLTGDVTRRARKANDGKTRNSNEDESLNLVKERNESSPTPLSMESSLLADLARAHNVFDCPPNEILSENHKNNEEDAGLLDVNVKQELIDASLPNNEDTLDEAIPLMKKPKLDT